MEMRELQQAWAGIEERLARQNETLREIRRQHGVDAARSRLRLVSLGQWVQLAVGIVVVLWAGGYWIGHLGEAHLVVYGVSVHLYGLGLLLDAAWQLERLARIDYRKPIVEVQHELVALRRRRVAGERVLLLAGFIVWVPLVFMAANAVGLDVWRRSPATVAWNLAAGVVLAAFVGWLTIRYRDTFERDAAGRSLRQAQAELDELARPERAD